MVLEWVAMNERTLALIDSALLAEEADTGKACGEAEHENEKRRDVLQVSCG